MPGLLSKPSIGGGLLMPVMWDRVRQRQGLLDMGTEGGGRGMGGGGGRGTAELPLEGGATRSRNVRHSGSERPTFDWAYTDTYGYNTTLPSGVKVYARPTWSNTVGRNNLNVEFSWGKTDRYAKGSTERGVKHLSEVADAVMDLQRRYNPKQFSFSALTSKHEKIYDRMAPKLAEVLGGTFRKPATRSYYIDLP